MRLHLPYLRVMLAWLAMTGTISVSSRAQAASVQPGVITPPKLLLGDGHVLPECKGMTPADVKIEFVVNEDGNATNAHVLDSPGPPQSACAIAVVLASKFVPAMRNGKPMAMKIVLTINAKE